MFLSDVNYNDVPVVKLDVTARNSEIGSDHDEYTKDSLEAEISKLETTINDLEANDDLPNIDSCAYDLEEGELLDSEIYEGELADSDIFKINEVIENDVSDSDTFSNCDDNIDGRMSQNIECNKGDKYTFSCELNESDGTSNAVSHGKRRKSDFSKPKTFQAETTTYEECTAQHKENGGRHTKGGTFQPELKIPNENVCNPMKSVLFSKKYEELSLRSQDCELTANDVKVHLNSIKTSDITSSYTTYCDTNAEGNKICPVGTHKDSAIVIKSSSLMDVDAAIHGSSQELNLQLDVSQIEDEFLYPDDGNDDVTCTFSETEDYEPLVSSTPFKIKVESLKRWKPTFSSVQESFLILDEYGESSDQEQSVCTYINSLVPNVSATQSTHLTHKSFSKVSKDNDVTDIWKEDCNDIEQTQAASGEGIGLKVVEKLSNETGNGGSQSSPSSSCTQLSPVLTNATPVQGHYGQDNTDNIKNSLEEKPNIISKCDEDYISNNPQENEDNNNPEWELLRKLQTDEERYRAVRQRWRNLIIPDPNQDLTYHNWKICKNARKYPTSASSVNNDAAVERISGGGSDVPSSVRDQHKRTVSDGQASCHYQPRVKRRRTQSCTAVFDVKLEQLRQNTEYERQQICDHEQLALLQLSMKQIEERNYLQNFCYTGINKEMHQLFFKQAGVGNVLHIVD